MSFDHCYLLMLTLVVLIYLCSMNQNYSYATIWRVNKDSPFTNHVYFSNDSEYYYWYFAWQ